MARKRGRPPHDDHLIAAEWHVVNAVRHGLSDAAIAKRRGISRDAVRFHVRNALAKLGLANRQELRHWSGAPAGSPKAQKETGMKSELQLGLPHHYTFGKLAFFDCGGTHRDRNPSCT